MGFSFVEVNYEEVMAQMFIMRNFKLLFFLNQIKFHNSEVDGNLRREKEV